MAGEWWYYVGWGIASVAGLWMGYRWGYQAGRSRQHADDIEQRIKYQEWERRHGR